MKIYQISLSLEQIAIARDFQNEKAEINQVTSDLADLVISMVPEPHIERWLLLDSEAFKTVFGKGCPGS